MWICQIIRVDVQIAEYGKEACAHDISGHFFEITCARAAKQADADSDAQRDYTEYEEDSKASHFF